jgi:hypothetical protein
MRDLAIFAIVKDEEHYIEEWVAFHLVQGVSKIFIADNGPSAELARILSPYIRAGFVELLTFTGVSEPQIPAYSLALEDFKRTNGFEWVAFIDADEFLFSPAGDSLPQILTKFRPFPAVAVNWVSFGSSGHIERPSNLGLEAYTVRGSLDHVVPYDHLKVATNDDGSIKYRSINSHIKTILRPGLTEGVGPNPHEFKYFDNKRAVNTNFQEVEGPWNEPVLIDTLRINHYWSRSIEDMRLKFERGRAASVARRSWQEMRTRDSLCTGIFDGTGLSFASKVRAVMNDFDCKRNHIPVQVLKNLSEAKDWSA